MTALGSALPTTHVETASSLPYAQYTLDLCTNHLYPGNYTATGCRGQIPQGVAYDSGKGEIFVANGGGSANNVSVISDKTDRVVATVPVGPNPYGVAYDARKGEVFVTNSNSNFVSVINDTTNTVVKNITVGTGTRDAVYDPGKGEVFVSNFGAFNVSVINDTTDRVVKNIRVGNGPWGEAYDSAKGDIFVANSNSGIASSNVSVISDSSNTGVASVVVGTYPAMVAYDSAKAEILVTNGDTDTLSIVNDSTDSVTDTVPVQSYPMGVAYASGKGEIFVADYGSSNVSVISDSTDAILETIDLGYIPEYMAYDLSNGHMYVSNVGQGTVTIISTTGGYPVTFTESGLPANTNWSMSVNGNVLTSSASSITFTEPNGTYNYTVGPVFLYDATPSSGSQKVAGAGVSVPITFAHVKMYPVTFKETGLPSGTLWYLNATGFPSANSTSNAIATSLPNGTCWSTVQSSNEQYAPYPANFNLTVAGKALYENVSFTLVTYQLNFTETGIPSGTDWSVTLNGVNHHSTNVTVTFIEPNGTYNYTVGALPGYVPNPSSGQAVVDGANSTMAVTWAPFVYDVNFTESGLPSGTSWSVTLNGTPSGSTSSGISFTEPNGTYAFTVGPVSGYSASPGSGNAYVRGSATSVQVTFVYVPPTGQYLVYFNESGLPSGTNWSVTLAGVQRSSTSGTVSFVETNNTYTFTVGAVAGYSASPSSGKVTVDGKATADSITFTSNAPGRYSVTFTENGLPSGTTWSVTLGAGTFQSSAPTISFTETNGTYPFSVGTVSGFTADPSSGTVTVSGSAVPKAITFAPLPPGEYQVELGETGLPTGTNWSVTLGGAQQFSTGSTITFTETNSTYSYTVGQVTGYTVSPSSGKVTVDGLPVSVTVTFTANALTTYDLAFTESGLPSGTSWSITLAGSTLTSASPTITFTELNGTYTYTVGTVPGYTPSPATASVTVDGNAVSVTIQFTASSNGTGNNGTTILGMPATEFYLLVVGVVAVVAVVAVVLLLRRKQKGESSQPQTLAQGYGTPQMPRAPYAPVQGYDGSQYPPAQPPPYYPPQP
jgi:YVTN family beta-propeller protein